MRLQTTARLVSAVLIVLFIAAGYMVSYSQKGVVSKVVFYVK
jgi:hypothetical protein